MQDFAQISRQFCPKNFC